jgi:vacuolar-type H+-ATPase subunit H
MAKSKSKKMRDQASELADRLAPHVEAARDKAAPVLADARDKAGPMLSDARDKAGPLLADARDKTAPLVADARERLSNDVLPALAAAVAAAGDATEDVRAEAKKRGKAAAAALKGDVEPPGEKKHRLRKLLIVLGLGGVAAAIAKKMSSRKPTTAWQSSYTPTPAPPSPVHAAPRHVDDTATDAGAAATAGDDDEAAALPGEAVADEAATPHAATTPDDPAEEIDLTKE